MRQLSLRDFVVCAAEEQKLATYEPLNKDVQESYSALVRFNRQQFFKLPIVAIETSKPFFYETANDMFKAIEANDYHVWNANSFPYLHPYAAKDAVLNQKHFLTSRIVHDYFGHYKNRIGFGALNELKLAAMTWKELPESARMAHVCEFVTQICFFDVYGTYPQQKAFRVSNTLLHMWEKLLEKGI